MMISTNNENKTIHIDNIEEYIINNNSNMNINTYNKLNNGEDNYLMRRIEKDIKKEFKNLDDIHMEGMKIEYLSEEVLSIKLHFLDLYYLHINKKGYLILEKEIKKNEYESKEEEKEYHIIHRIIKINNQYDIIMESVCERIRFLLELNKRGCLMKNFEHRINNFFSPINENINSSYMVIREEPGFDLCTPIGNIYFTIDEDYYINIDFDKKISKKYTDIISPIDKIHIKEFGKLNGGFAKISKFVMKVIYNCDIYEMRDKIVNSIKMIFKDNKSFNYQPNFSNNLLSSFYVFENFSINDNMYTLIIEENGETEFSMNNIKNNSRFSKKLGFVQFNYDNIIKTIFILIRNGLKESNESTNNNQ